MTVVIIGDVKGVNSFISYKHKSRASFNLSSHGLHLLVLSQNIVLLVILAI